MLVQTWKEEIDRVKNDPEYTAKQKENLTAYYEMQIRLSEYAAQEKAKQKARRRARRLIEQHKRLTAKIQKVDQEFKKIFYDDGKDRAFSYGTRREFRLKHMDGIQL